MITAPKINESQLKNFLNETYSFKVLRITFNPKGEASWGYIIETNKGKYFLKLYKKALPFLEEATELTFRLYSEFGIVEIVHAVKAINGKTTNIFENYQVVVFNFIEGKEIIYHAFHAFASEKQLANC